MTDNYFKSSTVKLSEICFYIFFSLLFFAKGIGLYDGQFWFKVCLIAAMAAWMAKQVLTDHTVKELCCLVILVVLGLLIYFVSHEKGALLCILLVCGMKGIDVKRTFRLGLAVWLLSFGGLFCLTSLHILDSSFKVHDKLGLGRIIRWSLGYAHPNVLHISCLVLVCLIGYLLQGKFSLKWFLMLETVNLYVFMYSLSATGFLAVNVFLILTVYWELRNKFCIIEKVLIQVCLPFCIFLSLAAPVILEEPMFSVVNKLVNNRLALSQWFLQNQPIHLLGTDVGKIVTSLRTMDNSYVFAYIAYGIVFFVLMIAGYMALIYRKSKSQDGAALCVILACLAAGITEPFLFNTSFKNISLIFLGNWMFESLGEGKKIFLLGKLNKEYAVRIPDFSSIYFRMKQVVCRHRRILACLAATAGITAGFIGFWKTPAPDRYILPRTAFETTDDIAETYYLASENDLPQAGDRVMGYVDETTDMVPFMGNITEMERFRNTVSAGVTAAVAIWAVGSLCVWRMETRHGDDYEER